MNGVWCRKLNRFIIYLHVFKAIPLTFIQDGTVATSKKHAVIVLALQRAGDHRALLGGGNIITDRHILTAAHLCVGYVAWHMVIQIAQLF